MINVPLLLNGSVVGYSKIDDEDAALLGGRRWGCRLGYATTVTSRAGGNKAKTVMLHREVMRAITGETIDHVNGDKLDNRKCNLRFCTRAENAYNMKPHKYRKTKLPRGVYMTKYGRFKVQIKANKTLYYFGSFKNERDAFAVRIEAEKDLHGAFASHLGTSQ